MTLPETPANPFGLWQPPDVAATPAAASADALSFSLPGEGAPRSDVSAVWALALNSGPDGRPAGGRELERMAAQVRSIEEGLAASGPRVEELLSARARELEGSGVSFSTSGEAAVLAMPPPEAGLAFALQTIEPTGEESVVSFGAPGALPAGVDWQALYQRLATLLDSVNRQILHYAWVDTTLDGQLVARSIVNWGGDLVTCWRPGLQQETITAHCRSFELAMASRLANLRAILTVSQIAGKITLALTTPLGPLQAMSLAWQFLSSVISEK